MKEHELPAGYVTVHGVAIHVDRLHEHTSDLQRFLRLLPITERFDALTPGSEQWESTLAEALAEPGITLNDIIATMRELGTFCIEQADELAGVSRPTH